MNRQAAPQTAQGGYSLVELLMVLLLLTLFGVTTFTLIYSGSNTYQKLADTQASQVNARVALGYLDVKIRQNDRSGAITVLTNPIGPGNALRVSSTYDIFELETWIFLHEGILKECVMNAGEPLDPSLAFDIVEISEFSIDLDDTGRIINIVIADTEGNGAQTRHRVSIGLRSAMVGGEGL